MSKTHGKFVWYDVMTSNPKTAESFYRSVIGWDAKDSGMTDRSYTILSMGPTMVGGLMPIPEDAARAGVGPAWMGYVAVDDVDIYAKRVKAAGGAVHRGPEDIPGVGRFAVAGDPHGAGFMLFKGMGDQAPMRRQAPPVTSVGVNSTPASAKAPSPSIPVCSAGPRARQSTWGPWVSTRPSQFMGRSPAA